MIRFSCPGCGATYSVTDEKAGKTGKCPKCQGQFVIPQAAAPAAPAAANDESVEIAPCPQCKSRLTVSRTDLGANVECPNCKTVYRAERPGAAAPRPTVPPPPTDPNAPVEIAPCPGCLAQLTVAAADLGAEVECPTCKAVYEAVRAGTVLPTSPKASKRPRRDEERPSKRKRRDDDDDDDDDDRPRSRRRRDDDDDEDDDRPRGRRGRSSRRGRGRSNSGGTATVMRYVAASLALLIGALGLFCGIVFALQDFLEWAGWYKMPFLLMSIVPRSLIDSKTMFDLVWYTTALGMFAVTALYLAAGICALIGVGFSRFLLIASAGVSCFLVLLIIYGVIRGAANNTSILKVDLVLLLVLYIAHAVVGFMATLGNAAASEYD